MAHALTAQSEVGLRELAVRGDEAAFEDLVGPLVEPGIRLAYSMLGDRWEAEDAVQEAVTRAWRKLHQLRPGMPVRPWFLAIVVNHCRNVRRTRWFSTIRIPEAHVFRDRARLVTQSLVGLSGRRIDLVAEVDEPGWRQAPYGWDAGSHRLDPTPHLASRG